MTDTVKVDDTNSFSEPEHKALVDQAHMLLEVSQELALDITTRAKDAIREGNIDYLHAVQQCERLFGALGFSHLEGLVVLSCLTARAGYFVGEQLAQHGKCSNADDGQAIVCNAVGLAAVVLLATSEASKSVPASEVEAGVGELIKHAEEVDQAREEAEQATKQ